MTNVEWEGKGKRRVLHNPVNWEMVGLFIELVSTGGQQTSFVEGGHHGSDVQSLAYRHTAKKGQMVSEVDMSRGGLVGSLLVEGIWSAVKNMDSEVRQNWAPAALG